MRRIRIGLRGHVQTRIRCRCSSPPTPPRGRRPLRGCFQVPCTLLAVRTPLLENKLQFPAPGAVLIRLKTVLRIFVPGGRQQQQVTPTLALALVHTLQAHGPHFGLLTRGRSKYLDPLLCETHSDTHLTRHNARRQRDQPRVVVSNPPPVTPTSIQTLNIT
jgi:hypothetical protein